MLKSALRWLLRSSADPTKVSSTVKAALLGIVPVVIWLSGLTGAHFDSDAFTLAVNSIATVVQYALSFISAAWAAYGLIRKFWLTYQGTNHIEPTA